MLDVAGSIPAARSTLVLRPNALDQVLAVAWRSRSWRIRSWNGRLHGRHLLRDLPHSFFRRAIPLLLLEKSSLPADGLLNVRVKPNVVPDVAPPLGDQERGLEGDLFDVEVRLDLVHSAIVPGTLRAVNEMWPSCCVDRVGRFAADRFFSRYEASKE